MTLPSMLIFFQLKQCDANVHKFVTTKYPTKRVNYKSSCLYLKTWDVIIALAKHSQGSHENYGN